MIRLVTVIGHGSNLIPHFINHYETKVDEINMVVYVSDVNPNLEEEVYTKVNNHPKVKIISIINDRVFDWNRVTELYNQTKMRYPNDWWVVADIDEFHVYLNPVKFIVDDCEKNGYELVRGGFIDRIGPDGEFVELEDDKYIWEQFPNAGFFRYPMSKACPNKVCIMKGHIEITSGQHYAKIDGQTTWKWQGWNHPLIDPYHSVQVHHFKWDKTSIDRIKSVASIKQVYAFSDEYNKMYKSLNQTNFKIDLKNKEFMFESNQIRPKYDEYRNWNKLYKKIISI
jgi:hypothetical protein